MESIDLAQFSIENFRTWLESKEPDAIIGTAYNPYDCPIANWVKSILKTAASVATNGLVSTGTSTFQLPNWVDVFIMCVDTCNWMQISARQGLQFLERVERIINPS